MSMSTPDDSPDLNAEASAELVGAVYAAMDAGLDADDVRSMVDQAIDTWVPEEDTERA